MRPTYKEIAKALIKDSKNLSTGTHFDFSNIEKLAKQLEGIFIVRWGQNMRPKLSKVADYIKNLK